MTIQERVQTLADEAIKSYPFPPDARATLISISENMTFIVENREPLGVLRLYRAENQTVDEIRSELAWINSLVESDLINTPKIIRTSEGDQLGTVLQNGTTPRYFAMFEYIEGVPPASTRTDLYQILGTTVAKLHEHVTGWQPPEGFSRSTWNVETILGDSAPWGNWRDGPQMAEQFERDIERAERELQKRLAEYPQTSENSGLVHGDLREANLIMDETEALWVIDYDDSGMSWFLWDLASSTSFLENAPNLAEIVDAWLTGYSRIRQLNPRDLQAIPDIVFLRRLHLLAWMGSHPDGGPVQEFGDGFARETASIARTYLDGTYLQDSYWVGKNTSN